MKTLRRIHLYLGCFFSPLIIYFAVSGSWQIFRFNNLPKDDGEPTFLNSLLHELSKPHTHSTLPGLSAKTDHSPAFMAISLLMGIGLILSASLGITLALRHGPSKREALLCLLIGVALPIALLFLR